MGSTANEIMMFIDTSKCIGCKSCQVACKQWHSLPEETDDGTVTDSSTTTLEDSAKNWAINEWANLGVEILTGTPVGQKRTIVSNTETTLTFSPSGTAPGVGSKYGISTVFNGTYTNPPDMSGRTLTVVRFNESRGDADSSPATWWTGDDFEVGGISVPGSEGTVAGVQFLFFKDQCRHCYQPKCKRGCPDGVYQTTEGFVLFGANCNDKYCSFRNQVNTNYHVGSPNPLDSNYNPDYDKRYIPITMADHCPYNIPRLSKSGNDILDKSFDRYVKCDFCYDRFTKDDNGITQDIYLRPEKVTLLRNAGANQHTTACEYACPTGAIITGYNKDIIGYTGGELTTENPDDGMGNPDSYANRRLREIKSTYPLANIYHGLWGRVHVIYLLVAAPERYGLLTSPDSKLGVPGTPSDWAEGDLTWPW